MSTAELCQSCNFGPSLLLPDDAQSNHLQHLLRSNLPPPSPDISHFRHVASSMPLELSRYDEQISRIQSQLNRLTQERDSLRYYAAGCGSLFSPIRRLPTELLGDIFAIFPQLQWPRISERTPDREICRLGRLDLLRLSQVCSHWKHVVTNTPILWSNIAVNFDSWYRVPEELRERFRSSLQRGGILPLQISVYAWDDAPQQQEWGLELLSQHSHRWRQISLHLHPSFIRCLSSVRGRLPLLEKIDIDGWDAWPTDFDIFSVVPRLKSATLSLNYCTSTPLPSNLLPWEQLMNFQIDGVTMENLLDICPLLACLPIGAELGLDMAEYDAVHLALAPVVSNIFSLRLKLSISAVGQIIQTLTLPYARELSFISSGSGHLWDQAHFRRFAARSSFKDSLKALELKCLTITDVELLQCLSELPLLQRLSLADRPKPSHWESADHILLTDNLLHRLSLRPDTIPLIPDLQLFRIISRFRFSAQAYVDFIRSRLVPRSSNDTPFAANMSWFPGQKVDYMAWCPWLHGEFPEDLSTVISVFDESVSNAIFVPYSNRTV